MNVNHNQKLTRNAQKLRKDMTPHERKLWYNFLHDLPITVHRQKVIGHYIVDFYCAGDKVVIELDGSQHFEHMGVKKDEQRDTFLRQNGYTVLHYANSDIDRNFRGVCEDILQHITLPSP